MSRKAIDYSLADFFITSSPDMAKPEPEFLAWQKEGAAVLQLYEPIYEGGPLPRAALVRDGVARPVVNLSSYGYLGLSHHPHVLACAEAAMKEYGVGMCGSPILSGRNALHVELERRMSLLLRKEAILLFPSGFGGALGTVAALARRGDTVITDSSMHMSGMDGARLAGAKLVFFDHNRAESLDRVLQEERAQRRMILLEGIYSMDGDLVDLPAILKVAEAHRVPVFIDEAHSILACGTHGGGVVEHFQAEDRIALHFGCFSKAFGALGAFVGTSRDTWSYLRLYAHSYAFSAGLPPVIAGAVLGALDVMEKEPQIRERLWHNAEYLRTNLQGLGLDTGSSSSYIIPIILGSNRALLYEMCAALRERGLLVPPIDYPTVAQDQVRFRASVNAFHTQADLDQALNIIEATLVPALRAQGVLGKRN